MEGQGEEEEEEAKEGEGPKGQVEEEEGGEISMHALQGCASSKVLKVRGMVGKRKLVVLIDSGSSHSFLDEEMATTL